MIRSWLEAVVLLVRFGLPAGPRAAVIAPPGSWLQAQGIAIAANARCHRFERRRQPLVSGR